MSTAAPEKSSLELVTPTCEKGIGKVILAPIRKN